MVPRPVGRLRNLDTETTGLVAWTVHGFRVYASRPRNARFARSLAACALHKRSQAPSACAPPSLLKPFFFYWLCCHQLSFGLELFQPGLEGGCTSAHVVFFLKKTTHPPKNWSFAWKKCLILLKKTSQPRKKIKFCMKKWQKCQKRYRKEHPSPQKPEVLHEKLKSSYLWGLKKKKISTPNLTKLLNPYEIFFPLFYHIAI